MLDLLTVKVVNLLGPKLISGELPSGLRKFVIHISSTDDFDPFFRICLDLFHIDLPLFLLTGIFLVLLFLYKQFVVFRSHF